MKKTMMMAVILGVTALTAASFTGCSSAPRTIPATNTTKAEMPAVSAEAAATVKPTAVTVVSAEQATKAPTVAAKAEAAQAITAQAIAAPAAVKETKTEVAASRDANFRWFLTGVYKVSTDGSDLDTYYVFNDAQNGRVDTASGIGIGFTYEQNRNGVIFHMGCSDDNTLFTITEANGVSFTGTMYGHTYTFKLVDDTDPATFDAETYTNVQTPAAPVCNDGQNPVMNFIGNYSNGRATMNVSAKGQNEALVTVSWGSSAFQTTMWTMSGTVTQVGDTLVMNYMDCDCESFFFSEDGTSFQSVTEYVGGCGSITFSGNQADWDDFEQGVADGQVFSYVLN